MLLNKIGFYQTLYTLQGQGKISLKDFYESFNKISYYNAFYRVQEDMIKNRIIEMNGDRTIKLTNKGLAIIMLITEIENKPLNSLVKELSERGGRK